MKPTSKYTVYCNRCASAVTSYTYTKAQIEGAIETHILYSHSVAPASARSGISIHRSKELSYAKSRA